MSDTTQKIAAEAASKICGVLLEGYRINVNAKDAATFRNIIQAAIEKAREHDGQTIAVYKGKVLELERKLSAIEKRTKASESNARYWQGEAAARSRDNETLRAAHASEPWEAHGSRIRIGTRSINVAHPHAANELAVEHNATLQPAHASETPKCQNCGNTATCFGSYEGENHHGFACNECCGHGNEDGHCEPLSKFFTGLGETFNRNFREVQELSQALADANEIITSRAAHASETLYRKITVANSCLIPTSDVIIKQDANESVILRPIAHKPAHASERDELLRGIMRKFVGWLSGDIPELHKVEVPRLAESLERFLSQRAHASEQTGKP